MRTLALFCALCCFAGCEDNLPVSSFIDKIRVLAVQAEPPEVTVGNHTRLAALVVEPDHPLEAPGPLSYRWLACKASPDATFAIPCGLADATGKLDGSSAPPACPAQVDGTLCTLGEDATASLSPAASLVGDGTLLVTLVVSDRVAGATECLLSTARNDGLPTDPDHCVLAVKRVTVGDGTTPLNHNPTLARLDLVDLDGTVRSLLEDGVSVSASVVGEAAAVRDLRAQRDEGSAEQLADGSYEAMSLSWFTTAGRFQGARSTFDPPGCASQAECASTPPVTTAVTQWEAPDRAQAASQLDADGRMHLWAVLRDDRGGVGWRTGTITVK